MKRLSIILCALVASTMLNAQCLTHKSSQQGVNPNTFPAPAVMDLKTVRINVHFFSDVNATNWTATDDGHGNPYSGYQFSREMVAWMNNSNLTNPGMNIWQPPRPAILDKNIQFSLEGVYFHTVTNAYTMTGATIHNAYGVQTDSVMNIYLNNSPRGTSPGSYAQGGYASTVSHNPGFPRYTVNSGYWHRYTDYLNSPGQPFEWTMHSVGHNTNHEMFHLFGLSHTTAFNNAQHCPTFLTDGLDNMGQPNPNFIINPSCDDGCADTPTAWYMADTVGTGVHPFSGQPLYGGAWGNGWQPGMSSNLMDYSGVASLTPCQLDIVHTGLEGPLNKYKVCEAVKTNVEIHDLGFPKTGYYGKNVVIGPAPNTASSVYVAELEGKEYANIYFSESVDFNNFEINDKAEFEIIYVRECN